MWWLIKSNGDDNDKSETNSSNKENYETSSYNSDKECIRGNNNYNERIKWWYRKLYLWL